MPAIWDQVEYDPARVRPDENGGAMSGAMHVQDGTTRCTEHPETPLVHQPWFQDNPRLPHYGRDVIGYYCEGCGACVHVTTLYATRHDTASYYFPPPGRAPRVTTERMRQLSLLREIGDGWRGAPAILLDGPRTPRLVSSEQEVSSSPERATRLLAAAGFAPAEFDSRGVHTREQRHSDGRRVICHTKPDGSCAGEIVYSKLDLRKGARVGHSRHYGKALELVRRSGVQVDTNAGHHVHVSAKDRNGKGFGQASLFNLYSIMSHVEPVLYRLAAAGWDDHRGVGYCRALDRPNDPKSLKDVAMTLSGGERYRSVNLNPFFESLRGCRCGAFLVGDWEGCTCDHGKHTIEFRLWNASTRPDTIHAYVILSAAIVDLAVNARKPIRRKPIEVPTIGTEGYYDEDGDWNEGGRGTFVATPVSDSEREAWRWLYGSLSLSETEGRQLLNLANRSTLAGTIAGNDSPDGWAPMIEACNADGSQ